ncbi:hypothetical protein DID88_008107 [Monilinia fructigena]|uniref:Uncharacterized protein n=1 Tax=Monilinia fructigena TaxID=38457 RepID=A0A395J9F5_9HELO|nr:hypothetical protein DID88_008107 [Monilinia fructigena]
MLNTPRKNRYACLIIKLHISSFSPLDILYAPVLAIRKLFINGYLSLNSAFLSQQILISTESGKSTNEDDGIETNAG